MTVNYRKQGTIIRYLRLNPLKTKKQETFIKLLNVQKIMEKKEHLTAEGLKKIEEIKEKWRI